MAGSVGFEPTGLSSHQISSLRRYDHFGNYPHLECQVRFELTMIYLLGRQAPSTSRRLAHMEHVEGADPSASSLATRRSTAELHMHWSGWCESNTRFSVPKADDFPLAYIPIVGTGDTTCTCTPYGRRF